MFWVSAAPWIFIIAAILFFVRRNVRSKNAGLDRILVRPSSHWPWISRPALVVYSLLTAVALAVRFFGNEVISDSTVVLAVAAGIYTFYYDRFRRHDEFCASVVEREYLVCPQCTYDLRAIGASGECPECGTPFTQDDLPRAWKAIFPPHVRRKLFGHVDAV